MLSTTTSKVKVTLINKNEEEVLKSFIVRSEALMIKEQKDAVSDTTMLIKDKMPVTKK
jgi:hypothetical protein